MSSIEQPPVQPPEQFPGVDPQLTTEALAATWFDPDRIADHEGEYRDRTAALVGREPTDALSLKIGQRLCFGLDPLLAEVLVERTLEVAYDEDRAMIDSLTGFKTYPAMQDWLGRVYGRSVGGFYVSDNIRHPRSATFYSGDLANFKRINDELGRKAGDHVLKCMGQEVTASMRVADKYAIARGNTKGDETLIAVADLDKNEATGMLARLHNYQRRKVESDRQQTLWLQIMAAIDTCPSYEGRTKYVKFEQREQRDADGKVTSVEMLVINGHVICPPADLAVIDWGFAHGTVTSLEVLPELEAAAEVSRERTKDMTHREAGGKYRPTH